MSSIAYITDNKILEFHRIHGHRTMNFWRFYSKNFTDFVIGDMLFFLVKKSERPNSSEKGILGCGRLVANETMSIRRMWNGYGQRNGVNSFEELKETIQKASKDRSMPRSMNCLILEDVIYFNEPLYLSDYGIQISNYLEGYTYLNNFGDDIADRLLKDAKDVGIDIWASVLSGSNDSVFEKQLIVNKIHDIHQSIGELHYSDKKDRLLQRKARAFAEKNTEYTAFKNSSIEFYKVENNIVYLLFVNIAEDVNDEEYKKLIGHLILFRDKCLKEGLELRIKIANDFEESLIGYLGE